MSSSSVFFYELFYDFDCFFEEMFSPSCQVATQNSNNNRQRNIDRAVRSFKPRYVFFSNPFPCKIEAYRWTAYSRMDLHEDNEKNLITATFKFPGMPKENISIDVHNGKLTVSAEMKQSSKHDENGYVVRE